MTSSPDNEVASKKRQGDPILENDPKRARMESTLIKKEPTEESGGTTTSLKLEPVENTEDMLGTWISNKTTLLVGENPVHGDDQSMMMVANAKSVALAKALQPVPSKPLPSPTTIGSKKKISTQSATMLPKTRACAPASTPTEGKRKGVFTPKTRKIMEVIYRKGKSKQPAIRDMCQLITSLEVKQIKQWFSDRRKKGKKKGEAEPTEENPLPLDELVPDTTKERKGFSSFQRDILSTTYEANVLANKNVLVLLSEVLGLTIKQIKQWRSDRRKRERAASGVRAKPRARKKTAVARKAQVTRAPDPTPIVKSEVFDPKSLICPGTTLDPFDPSRIAPPALILKDGLNDAFLCCGCALEKPEDTISTCSSCHKKFHQICLEHIFKHTELPSPEESWECPRCKPVNFPNAALPMATHVPNGRGQYYYKGQPIDAQDRNTGTYTRATVFMVGRDSILLHFDNWSNIYNQWIPSNNPKVRPVMISAAPQPLPEPRPKTPIQRKQHTIAARGRPVPALLDEKARRGLLKISWEAGLLMQDSFIHFLSAATGQTEKQLRKYRSDCKYRAQKKGQAIPVFNPSNPVRNTGIDPLKFLGSLWDNGILKTRNKGYEDAVSALTGLSVPKIKKWMSDRRYREKKKAKLEGNLAVGAEPAPSHGTISTLRPYQELILRSAMSIGKLNATNPLTHRHMAIYCGISEVDVNNFLNKC